MKATAISRETRSQSILAAEYPLATTPAALTARAFPITAKGKFINSTILANAPTIPTSSDPNIRPKATVGIEVNTLVASRNHKKLKLSFSML